MTSRTNAFRNSVAIFALVAGFAVMADTAAAQTQPAAQGGADEASENTTIVVTGSRIRRNPLDQDAPITFVDRSDIDRTGLSSVADVLQRLPGAGGGLNSKFNNSGNFGNPPDGGGVGAGAAEIDLRYLGSRRTLVLVDGLRWVNGSSASGVPGSTDLNTIPEGMIDRVEVLQDGASPIYGSDAIAGVVNIITKRKQNGFMGSAQVGAFKQGDGTTQNYNLSWGHHDEDTGTSIVIGGNYVKQSSVSSADRRISQFPTPGTTACDSSCSSGTPLGRFIVAPNGTSLNLTLKQAVPGRPRYDPANPTGPNSDFKDFTTADRFNFAPFNYIQTPSERYGGFLNFSQELGGDVTFRIKAVYNRRNSQNKAAFLPLFIGPDAGNGNLLDTIAIDASNPFNPFGVTLDSSNYAFIARRVVEGGQRTYNQSVNTYYIGGTLEGSFEMGAGKWYWDANAIYSVNDAKQSFTGNVNADKVRRALGPVAACTSAGDGCTPLNVFGGVGSITPAMYNYIAFVDRANSSQNLKDFSLNLSGNLFELPAGPVGLAIGYEHRALQGRFTPDPIVSAGFGSDIPAQPTAGRINSDEVYAEVNVPLLKDAAFFNSLEASFAARYSDYSSSGSDTTLKAGLNWKPTEDLLIRGSWAQGFRAPTIGELFGTLSRFDQELVDPCSDLNNNGASATVKANCVARGVPANGSYVQTNPQLSVITGGSQALKAESSRSWMAGAVYSPGWANKRLSFEVNYYNVKVSKAIQAISAVTLLDRCAQQNDASSCAAITRTNSGAIAQIRSPLQNIAGIETQGFDVTLNYRTPDTGAGIFGVYLSNSFLLDYTQIVPATNGVTRIKREGTEQGSPDQAYPKYKATGTLDWSSNGFKASVTGRYIASVKETQVVNKLKSRFYTDLQLGWTPAMWDDKIGFTIGVNNLLNSGPPPCISCGLNNFDPGTYDVPGRFGYARVSFKM